MPGIEKMRKRDIVFGIMIAVFLVFFLSPFASKLPDGLEKAAQDQGFLRQEKRWLPALMAGYFFPGIKNEKSAVVIAGILGIAVVFFVSYLFGVLIKKSKK